MVLPYFLKNLWNISDFAPVGTLIIFKFLLYNFNFKFVSSLYVGL